MDQKKKIWAIVKGPSQRRRDPSPHQRRRSHCSQHGHVVFLFRFVFPLFRKLVYWTNEDPFKCVKGSIHVCKVK